MADFEGNHPLAGERYRELLSLWHETEDRMFAVPGIVSAAGFYVDRRDGVNLAACCEIVDVIAQENQNEETRAASREVLAETAWYHGDLTSAIALMREAVEGYDRVGSSRKIELPDTDRSGQLRDVPGIVGAQRLGRSCWRRKSLTVIAVDQYRNKPILLRPVFRAKTLHKMLKNLDLCY